MEGRIGKLYERTHLHGRTHTKIAWKYAGVNNIGSTHGTCNGRTHRVLLLKDVFNASFEDAEDLTYNVKGKCILKPDLNQFLLRSSGC